MIIETLSTFPGMYESVMGASMMRIAQEKGILQFRAHDLRDWTHDRHRTTDDDPYGGGHGLVMKCEPIFEAYEAICSDCSCGRGARDGADDYGERNSAGHGGASGDAANPPERFACQSAKPCVVFLAPHGEPFTDRTAGELAREERLLFVCGHYEGIDERAYALADRIISLGDYVLTSGELASMVVIDAVVRKLPGVLGAAEGPLDESFSDGLLEYPQYTRPANFRGMEVPAVLLSGDHAAVDAWRRRSALERTALLRPDLLDTVELSPADREFLESFTQVRGA